MPRLNYSPRAMADLARFQKFLVDVDYENTGKVIELIFNSLDLLTSMPFSGRIVLDSDNLRELIIPFGNSGYMALYQYIPENDLVRILALKHQREDDYK